MRVTGKKRNDFLAQQTPLLIRGMAWFLKHFAKGTYLTIIYGEKKEAEKALGTLHFIIGWGITMATCILLLALMS